MLRTFIHRKPAVVTLGFAKTAQDPVLEQVTCTPNHPFWVKGTGFVQAGELGIGTQIVTRAGPALFLVSAKRRNEPAGVLVYNFEVAGDHTYFVGRAGGGLWVHNVCLPDEPYESFDAARRAAFKQAGMSDPDSVTLGMEDPTGTVVEFHGPGGAKVAYDGLHIDMDPANGHDLPHVGWQTAGKRASGAAMRGNNTYLGAHGPERP